MGIFDNLRKNQPLVEDTEESIQLQEQDRVINGKILKISEEGWGFITSQEIPFTRIFFHWTSLKHDTLNFKELKKGMRVEFTPIESEDKGWRAIKISVKD